MQKELLQIICNYLGLHTFCKLKDIYGLSIDNYIRNTHRTKIELPIINHNITDEFIKRHHINDVDVIDYALEYDRPEYIDLEYIDGKLYAKYNLYMEHIIPQICSMPNIIKRNYKENNFRLAENHLNVIFEENCIELMLFVQDYPEKSNINIRRYNLRHSDLWRLNHKHKIANIFTTYFIGVFIMSCLIAIPLSILISVICFDTLYSFNSQLIVGSLIIVDLICIAYINHKFTYANLPL